MFAYEYYSISRVMPFVIMEKTVPENLLISNERINKVMLVLNILLPLLEAIGYFIFDLSEKFAILMSISKYAVIFLQVTAAVFLAIGINKIRKFVKDGSNNEEIDVG